MQPLQPRQGPGRYPVDRDGTGNLPPSPAIFPDQMAPIVRLADGERELAMMRWGFPSPVSKGLQHPVTNVRNVRSPYWRSWLKPEQCCLVPVSSFNEYADTKPCKTPVWFALDEDRPLFAFAGIWRPWTGVRGPKRDELVEEEHRLYALLTTEANGIVEPVHPKAMPVLMTTPEEWRTWLEAPVEEVLFLQRPLLDKKMMEVERGKRTDTAQSRA
ncbi:SOS response-associated peptidase family protein [Methylobacterium sp. WL6]|uniref:SOS response-associated peptidase n=1 Tax=Methylobacterium sp. WL6 TaxID=2603901 RepID=UPI0032B1C9E5